MIKLPSTGIVILAAGSSTRLGRPKQLLLYQSQTLLRRVAETAVAAANGGPVVVVTGALHGELLAEGRGLPVEFVYCPGWDRGMGASLKAGLAALERHHPSVLLVVLCDQPHVTSALLRQLVRAHAVTERPIVASEYGGVRGVPVLFARNIFPLLRTLPDDAGAATLLKQYPERVATVPFPEGAIDVDTLAQYAALLAAH